MSASDLTVVIPAFGTRGGLLERALESVLPGPVIVVDDATPDHSVAELVARHPVRYVRRSTNGGVAAAQNFGLTFVDTTWVQFLHSDDELLPSAWEAAHPSGFSVVQGCEQGRQVPERAPDARELLEHRVGVHISNYQFRTEFLRSFNFDEDLRAWEDWDLVFRIARCEHSVYLCGVPFARISREATDRLAASSAMLDGLAHLYEKFEHDLRRDRRARSIWEFKLARMSVLHGERREAWRWLARSLRTEPLHPRRVLALIVLLRKHRSS